MTLPPIPYRIERTRNRSSRATFRGGEILIRLAGRLSLLEERIHIESLLRRMQSVAVRELQRHSIDPFTPLLNGETELALAPCIGSPLIFQLQIGAKGKIRKTGSLVRIPLPNAISKRSLEKHLWKIFVWAMQKDTENFIHEVNARTLNVHIARISLRVMTSQWGSCSSRGRITLNPALLFLPKETFEYVIIHELAHRIHHNHSKAFWKTVEQYVLDVKRQRKILRQHRLEKS